MANIDDATLTEYLRYKSRSPFSGLSEPHSVLDQMWMDDISLPPIAEFIRDWQSRTPDVRRVTIGYALGYYIAFLADALEMENIQRHFRELYSARELFRGYPLTLYPLGPNQSGSVLLNSIEVYDVI